MRESIPFISLSTWLKSSSQDWLGVFLGPLGFPTINYLTFNILLFQDNDKSVQCTHHILTCYLFSYKLKRSSYCLNCWQEFHRQGDSNTIDQHKLPVPVTARYLRFNPTQRHAWNCLRVEVYGTERELLPLSTSLTTEISSNQSRFSCVVVTFSEEKMKHNCQR